MYHPAEVGSDSEHAQLDIAIYVFICVLIIALVTFLICVLGIEIGKKIGTKLSDKATIFGGILLIFIGVETFYSFF